MTDKQIIDGENLDRIKNLLFEGQRDAISTKTFEAIIETLELKEQECEKLKNDKFALEVHIDSLTSPVNVDDCEHSVYNGEYIACRYYEGQRCDELDFSNCMFRENVRLKQQHDQLKAKNDELKKQVDDLLHKPEIQDKILWKIDNEKLLLSKDTYIYKLEKTLAEIKELLLKTSTDSQKHCVNAKSVILQKIREVIPDER